MASTLVITKVSGVLFLKPNGVTNSKGYFGERGSYQAADDNLTLIVSITNGLNVDSFTLPYTGLTVGTSTPTTMSSALILLNAIFGT